MECPGAALRCASSLEGSQPPRACGLPPHRPTVAAVNTKGPILIWVSWVLPTCREAVAPQDLAQEHRLGHGMSAEQRGAARAAPAWSRAGTLRMSGDKPGQPRLCHLQSPRGRRGCRGETCSSLAHGPQGPCGRQPCASSAFPSRPRHGVICAEELNSCAVQRQRHSCSYMISATRNSLPERNNLFLG